MEQQPELSSGFFTLLIGALMYSCLGLIAGIFWTYAAGAMGLPSLGILPFLALWWVWLFVWLPPIVVAISVFHATDPLAQMAKNLSKLPKGPNT